MGNLLDLIANMTPAPVVTTTAPALIEVTSAPAANDPQPASEPLQAPATPAPRPTPAPAAQRAPEAAGEPLGFILTAATASPEWRQSRDRYMTHLMACRACYAPTSRYCQTGDELRAIYNATPVADS